MAKIYFLGGEYIEKRDSERINRKAFADAGGAPAVLVFPWARETVDTADPKRKMMVEYFKHLGASKTEFAETADSMKIIMEKINSSELIYLPGGLTKLLVERLKKAKIAALLRKYDKVIIGNSAGAHALCKKYIGMKEQDDRMATEVAQGLGLVNFSVVVHYNVSYDKELMPLSEKMKIYGIRERSALVYENGKVKFIGNVFLFYKGEKTKCE